MSKKYGTIITDAGAALIAQCILEGNVLPITEAAAGDGNGAYYEPTTDQIALRRECWRGGIADFALSEYAPNMLDVKIIIDDEVGGFTIREMGLFSEDGTLIAICNTPDTEKISISGGIPGRLTMIMHIIVADASVIEVIINPELDSVTPEQLAAAIGSHNADQGSHQDIRELAANSMQHGDAYTKAETDEKNATDIATHNSDANAHPALHIDLSSIDSRLNSLELKFGTNITANPFAVDFQTLNGLIVTGVWNREYARIEF